MNKEKYKSPIPLQIYFFIGALLYLTGFGAYLYHYYIHSSIVVELVGMRIGFIGASLIFLGAVILFIQATKGEKDEGRS